MKKKLTHTGILRGCDNRTPIDYERPVRLRCTKTNWITDDGMLFRKNDGRGQGTWPMYRLDLETIKLGAS